MPLAQAKFQMPEPQTGPGDAFAFAPDRIVGTPSAAALLQRRIEQHAAGTVSAGAEKWSARRSVALILGASVALWFALLAGAAQLYHAVA